MIKWDKAIFKMGFYYTFKPFSSVCPSVIIVKTNKQSKFPILTLALKKKVDGQAGTKKLQNSTNFGNHTKSFFFFEKVNYKTIYKSFPLGRELDN